MACLQQVVLAVSLAVLLSLAAVEAGAITKRRAPSLFDAELIEDKVGGGLQLSESDVEFFNKMVMRIMDTLIEDARDRGVTSSALDNMMRKRGGIRKCFFHAVNCW